MTDSVAVLPPGFRVLDSNGDPVSGAKLKFYDAGTSDPKTVYSDNTLSTALGTTVYCDSAGYPVSTEAGSTKIQVYVGTDDYKLVITDADDVTLASHDNIKGAVNATSLAADFARAQEPVLSVTSSRSIISTDYGKFIKANPSSGSITLTLPTAATAGDGKRLRVRHVGSSGVVTVAASGSDTIAGVKGTSTSYTLETFGKSALFISTGAGWEAIATVISDGEITAAMLSDAISGTFVQTGSIIAWPHNTLPSGYLECNGAAVSRTTYSELFAVIAETYGNGDGSTTFNLPDYRGMFLRGHNNSAGVDPDAASRTDRGDGTTGDAVGTRQANTITSHNHAKGSIAVSVANDGSHRHFSAVGSGSAAVSSTVTMADAVVWGTDASYTLAGNSGTPSVSPTSLIADHNHTASVTGSTASTGSNETRPINVAVKWLIFAGGSIASGSSGTFHTILHGAGTPANDLGNNDDFYIDTTTQTLWGPKAGGSWADTDYNLGFTVIGAWADAETYAIGDVVSNNSGSYVCILAHTATTDDEPGTGVNEATYWVQLAAAGAAGATGAAGADGADGTDPGLLYTFSTTTADADPGAGYLRANNADLSSATAIYIDDADRNGNNHEATILTWDDATNSVTRGTLLISTPSNGAQVIFSVSGNSTDNSGYTSLAVTYQSGATSFANDASISVAFIPAGNDSAGALPTGGTDGQVLTKQSATDGDANWESLPDSAYYSSVSSLTPHKNLVIKNDGTNPNYQVDVTADALQLFDGSGGRKEYASFSGTVDLSASGANGLDTGSEANSTWYYIWCVAKEDDTTALLFSVSATSPTMPSDYIYKGLLGAIYNESGGDLIKIAQRDNLVVRENIRDLAAGTATTFTSVSVSIPPIAAAWRGGLLVSNTSGVNRTIALSPDGVADPVYSVLSSGSLTCQAATPITASQTVYYRISSATNASAYIETSGWAF